MRFRLSRLLGPAVVVLVLLCSACVVAVQEEPGRPVHTPPPPPPHPAYDDDYGLFYDRLDPYGDWAWIEPYGWVWSPMRIQPGWRPYTVGRWIYTDDGWFWESGESWGWATYHYGRWTFHPRYGWVWIPGRDWAPAWVAWRHGNGYIGWAPLPPQAVWRVGVGLDYGGVDIDVIIQPFWWGFCEERRILDPQIGGRLVPSARNVTIVRSTRDVTRYTVNKNRVIVHGMDVDDFERKEKYKVARYRVVDDDRDENRRGNVMGQELRVFRPSVKEAPPARAPRDAIPRETERPPKEARGGNGAAQPVEVPPAQLPTKIPERSVPRRVSEEQLRSQHEEQREFERRQAEERKRLEQLQRDETRRAPTPATAEALQKQHEEELRAHQERVTREQQVLENKQRREAGFKKRTEGAATGPKKSAPPARKKEEPTGKDEKDKQEQKATDQKGN